MLTKEEEPKEPWGKPTDSSASFSLILSTILFVFALILMCICEAEVTHGLWFNSNLHLSILKRFNITLGVLIPGLMGVAIRLAVNRQSKTGETSLRAASTLNSFLGSLLVFTYIAISNLVNVAFP